jgi:hypothetical protein
MPIPSGLWMSKRYLEEKVRVYDPFVTGATLSGGVFDKLKKQAAGYI